MVERQGGMKPGEQFLAGVLGMVGEVSAENT